MKTALKRVTGGLAAVALAGSLASCSNEGKDAEGGADATATAAAPASGESTETPKEGETDSGDAGFREEPIGDEVFEGPLKIAAVYFQPVEMEPQMGVPAAQAAMHLEADIAAVPDNGLGYGAGDFIPGLTVDYKVMDKSDKEVQAGTFMPMNASDGPHYGLNLPALPAGDYKLQIIVKSPETNGWMLHTDPVTGVPGKFWAEPIVAEFENWHWDPATVWW
ncbi:iron transporter [Gephyromycinifex aptenodytis]|uniref:iron transporter n=1 Tax=Gephyromycinifex aptenodytis TaxID=2716227 RepID=UPI001444ECB8|nr:iron transporter [Gephyromycinifex aptenodytis]